MTKLIVLFRNFAQAPINSMSINTVHKTQYLAGIQLLFMQLPRATLPLKNVHSSFVVTRWYL